MSEFLKYYWNNVLKKWWNLLLILISIISSFIFESTSFIIKLALFVGILFPGLLIIHIFALYKLWNKQNNESISIGSESIPDKIYEEIAKMIEEIIPEKSKDFRKNFFEAQKLFQDSSSNVKLLITKHFTSYKIIKDFFDAESGKNRFTVVSEDLSIIKKDFNENFSNLNYYNQCLGKNKIEEIDDTKVRNLISKINNNLLSLFSYIKS